MRIGLLTQRPNQAIILMYWIGYYGYKFDVVFFRNTKNEISHDEDKFGFSALKFQCKIQKIPIYQINNKFENKIIKLSKKIKLSALISNVTDFIIDNKVISIFNKGVFGIHGGFLPYFRGLDTNKWSKLLNNYVGISLFKIDKGVDSGKIIKTKKKLINNKKIDFEKIEAELFYKYKIYFYKDIFIMLKKNKKIKFQKFKNVYPQYFSMHKKISDLISK